MKTELSVVSAKQRLGKVDLSRHWRWILLLSLVAALAQRCPFLMLKMAEEGAGPATLSGQTETQSHCKRRLRRLYFGHSECSSPSIEMDPPRHQCRRHRSLEYLRPSAVHYE
eukprot:GILK01043153.1.p2 GENE.GILK01043153.1~~GILK01043153.1.p2  ORF type:complete len:112 (-),score=4.93 GILK01043153.1:159-494(-)